MQRIKIEFDSSARPSKLENLDTKEFHRLDISDESPPGFAIVADTGEIGGWKLEDVEYLQEGVAARMMLGEVIDLARRVDTRIKNPPILPPGVVWGPPGDPSKLSEQEIDAAESRAKRVSAKAERQLGIHRRSQWPQWVLIASGVSLITAGLLWRFSRRRA